VSAGIEKPAENRGFMARHAYLAKVVLCPLPPGRWSSA
jgi:hypothetical protein